MLYRSTRGGVVGRGFMEVMLEGLATDGGLYLPDEYPKLPPSWTELSYPELAAAVLRPFVEPDPITTDLPGICAAAYEDFSHPEVASIRDLGDGRHLLELFWGPTLSFKDYALQVIARLFDAVLQREGRRILLLGATSGDTGSAAIEACRGREAIDIVILYPHGRISDFQRRQMTTVPDANVAAVAVEGTFDDCQALVKQAFNDRSLRTSLGLAAVNSINWFRVAAQTVYYIWASGKVGGEVTFSVPTGNFGNVFAGYVAKQMGAPVGRLVVANNQNRGLSDLITQGCLGLAEVKATVAPAMDIQIPSNLERYLFELFGRDPARVDRLQARLISDGRIDLSSEERGEMVSYFAGGWIDDRQTIETMRMFYEQEGVVIDPHTAIGWEVGRRLQRPGEQLIAIATAHPAKCADAVEKAIGLSPSLPSELVGLMERGERITRISPDIEELRALLTKTANLRS